MSEKNQRKKKSKCQHRDLTNMKVEMAKKLKKKLS